MGLSIEICRISWNPHEIWWISWNLADFRWNPADFMWNPPKTFKSRCFNQNYPVWWMQERGYDPGFHEIRGHSPLHAPPKLRSFCWNIWLYKVVDGFQVKSAGFHEICQISPEIRRISKLWAFVWWPSIGLSFFERPMKRNWCLYLGDLPGLIGKKYQWIANLIRVNRKFCDS